MIKPVGFLLILSLVGYAFSSSKPVSIRDKATGQLVTSSLLTWESFNSKGDIKQQFENAIAGGNFTGADVRFSSTKVWCQNILTFLLLHLEKTCLHMPIYNRCCSFNRFCPKT